jgi:hypothetical protein
MRDFLNGILAFIGAASLTDEEWEGIDLTIQALNVETFEVLLSVLDARESISSTRERLKKYFEAAGVEVILTTTAKSNIYMGDILE